MLPATSSGERALSARCGVASRACHIRAAPELRNTSITPPADARLRSDYIDAAGKRLGRALHKVYGNSTLDCGRHALAEEHDDLGRGTPPPPAASWWGTSAAAAAAVCRRRAAAARRAAATAGRRVAERPRLARGGRLAGRRRAAARLVGAARRRQRDGDGERDGEHFARAVQQPLLLPPTRAAGCGERARRRAERAPAGRPARQTRGLLRHSGEAALDASRPPSRSWRSRRRSKTARIRRTRARSTRSPRTPRAVPRVEPDRARHESAVRQYGERDEPAHGGGDECALQVLGAGRLPGRLDVVAHPRPGTGRRAPSAPSTAGCRRLVADPFGRQYGHNELRVAPLLHLLETYLRFCTPAARAPSSARPSAAPPTPPLRPTPPPSSSIGSQKGTARRRRRAAARRRRVREAAAAGGTRAAARWRAGGRPIGAHGGRPFIDDIIKQIENFIKSLLTIINLIKGIRRRARPRDRLPAVGADVVDPPSAAVAHASASSPPPGAPVTRPARVASPTRPVDPYDPTRPVLPPWETRAPRCATRPSRRTPATASRRGAVT